MWAIAHLDMAITNGHCTASHNQFSTTLKKCDIHSKTAKLFKKAVALQCMEKRPG